MAPEPRDPPADPTNRLTGALDSSAGASGPRSASADPGGEEADGVGAFLRRAFLQRQGPLSVGRGALSGATVGLPVLAGVLGGAPSVGFTIALGALQATFVDGAYPYRRRAAMLVTTTVGCAIAMFVGTLAGGVPWAAVVAVAGWATLATYSGVFGPRYDPVGLVTTMVVLMGTVAPGDAGFALRQALLVLAGGAWCSTLALVASRWHRDQPPNIAATGALNAAAGAFGILTRTTADQWTSVPIRRDLRAAVGGLRARVADLRDANQATYGRSIAGQRLRVLALGLERTSSRLSALVETMSATAARDAPGTDAGAGVGAPGVAGVAAGPQSAGAAQAPTPPGLEPAAERSSLPPPVLRALEAVVTRLAAETARAAETAGARGDVARPSTRPDPALTETIEARRRAQDELVAAVDATRLVELHRPGTVPVMADLGVVVRAVDRLGDAADLAVEAAMGADPAPEHPDTDEPGRRQPAEVLRPHLSLQAPRTRLALRVLVATAISETVVQAAGITHGIWLVLTLLVILRTDRATTWTRAAQRLAGTVVGACIAALLLGGVTNQIALAVVIGLLTALCMPLMNVNYGYFVALFTPMVLLLIDVASPNTWRTAMTRALLTVAGGAMALVVDALLWPAREADRLPGRLAATIAATGRYLDTVLAGYASGQPDWAALVRARRAAESSHAVAVDTTVRLIGGPRQERREVARLAPALEASLEVLRAVRAAALDTITAPGATTATATGTTPTDTAPAGTPPVSVEQELRELARHFRVEAAGVFAALAERAAGAKPALASPPGPPVVAADETGPLALPPALDTLLGRLYGDRAAEIGRGVDLRMATPLRDAVQRWHDLLRYLQRIEDRVGRLDAALAQLTEPDPRPGPTGDRGTRAPAP